MTDAVARQPATPAVLCVDNIPPQAIRDLGDYFDVRIERRAAGRPIEGTFWGEPEAGIIGNSVIVRGDTPVHSLLHELCHVVCMTPDRRRSLHGNAESDDDEEAAVCYLQILLAGSIVEVGAERMMRDMDAWGYSFPERKTRAWFRSAGDARSWLVDKGLINARGVVLHRLRTV